MKIKTNLEILEKKLLFVFLDSGVWNYNFMGNNYNNVTDLEAVFDNLSDDFYDLIIEFENRQDFKKFVSEDLVFRLINFCDNFQNFRNILLKV